MSVQLYGKASDADDFHVSNGTWARIWTYCRDVAPEITSRVMHGYTNDGDGLAQEDADALAQVLRARIAEGDVARHAASLESPCQIVEFLPVFVLFLEASGGFEIG